MNRTERQNLAVSKWIKSNGRGVIVAPTGLGKTRIALVAIKSFLSKNPNKIVRVIVPREPLKVQWIAQLSKYNLNASVEIINSAIKKEEHVDLLILDEIHRYFSDTFINIFKVKHPKLILGLSATFHRLDRKQNIIKDYCPVVDTISVREALQNGWLSNYREYKVLIDVEDYDIYKQASLDFQESFSVFNYDFNLAMKCVTDVIYRRYYGKTLGISAKDIDAIAFTWNRSLYARKSFIMNHPKKLEITRKILNARPFSKAITFSGTIAQSEKIGIGYVVNSKKTKKKNRLTIEEFSKMPSGVINTSKALNEGIDIPGLNLAIILTNSSSPTEKVQRINCHK
jgi:superfamily II DNA or RNA helicase